MFGIIDNNDKSQVFLTKNGDWQIWQKPANAKMVSIFCLGSGSGGGSGANGTASTARRGGGGGGSGAFSHGTFAASQLPDTLYVLVAQGGIGGAPLSSLNNGGAGALSYVCVQPNTTAINVLLQSGAVAATAGLAGGNGGTGGTGSTAWTGNILNNLGLATAQAGTNGGSGVISSTAASITPANIVCGGPSGGNTSTAAAFAGGNVTGSGFLNTIEGGASGTSAAGEDGSDGYSPNIFSLQKGMPIMFTAGSGGGASVSGAGGNGGAGGFGCGGGGGGAGFTSLSGGGGRGGDGLIIITCW